MLDKSRRAKGRVGLFFQANGVAVAHYDATRQVALNHSQWLEDTDLDNPNDLKKLIESWHLEGTATSFVLAPDDYQLLLVEAPAVADSEMQAALRWRIKDLINADISTAIIDYLELPHDAYHGRSKMLYVAVITQATSERIEQYTKAAGLQLDCIDIPEFALNNLIPLMTGEPSHSRALLCLQAPFSFINIIADQAVYLTRRVETIDNLIDTHSELLSALANNMLLDIQRSMDYYESQIGKPPCVKLTLLPLQAGESSLLTQFQRNLGVELEQLDLGEVLISNVALTPELQARTVVAIAAAMRDAPGAQL